MTFPASVFFLHGVNTSRSVPYSDLAQFDFRREGLIGPASTITVGRWHSSGTISRDVRRVLTSRKFRQEQADGVAEQMRTFLRLTVAASPKLGVLHSMGCPIGARAMLQIPMERRFPLLLLGNPLCHPWWGSLLRMVGYGFDPEAPAVSVVNHDDPVTTLRPALGGPLSRPAPYGDTVRIAVPGTPPGGAEHMLERYTGHFEVIRQAFALTTWI